MCPGGEAYSLSPVVCALIVSLLVAASILGGRTLRIAATALSLPAIVLHYYVVFYVSSTCGTAVYVLPLLIVESSSRGSALSPDFGQLLAIALAVLWRRELLKLVRKLL